MRFVPIVVLALLAGLPAHAAPGNVIFVTVDGVRFQEFFDGVKKPRRAEKSRGTPLFPSVHAAAARGDAWIYGDGDRTGTFRIGDSAALSLPGYRAIFSGEYEDRCRDNGCPNIDHDTLFDSLVDRGFVRSDLAAFASWDGIGNAIEHTRGRIARDIAADAYPATDAAPDEAFRAAEIESSARADLPPWLYRRDVYTYALGRLYLERHHPRFLYLSLGDSDEYGHLNEYRNYTDTLLRYDGWIAELRAALAVMGDYGENTSIVVTTDHGRGRGPFWSSHGKHLSSAFRTWAVVIPSPRIRSAALVRPRIAQRYSQLDLRPTIEELLGLSATKDDLHPGLSLVESTTVQSPIQ